ncbi:MAG: NAD(P)-binding domain-containing protein [bacterium]|nr:MAG: NAD(P)-binding domain-containing protein [bacterium]
MNEKQIFGFIGGGRVTYFLLKALQQKNALPEKTIISDPDEVVLKKVQQISQEKIKCVRDNKQATQADWVFLAVHPPVIKDVIEEIKTEIKKQAIFISLAPVVKIEKLSALLGGFNRIVRMIPNAPSIIHQGYNPVYFGIGIKQNEKTALMNLFQHWGQAPEVDEDKLEAYAIVTAMGPTYFWPQWVKLQQLGLEFGMTESELKIAMSAMLTGAVNVLYQSDLSSDEVMDLIPVYPLKDEENSIKEIFQNKLTGLYQKLTKK